MSAAPVSGFICFSLRYFHLNFLVVYRMTVPRKQSFRSAPWGGREHEVSTSVWSLRRHTLLTVSEGPALSTEGPLLQLLRDAVNSVRLRARSICARSCSVCSVHCKGQGCCAYLFMQLGPLPHAAGDLEHGSVTECLSSQPETVLDLLPNPAP